MYTFSNKEIISYSNKLENYFFTSYKKDNLESLGLLSGLSGIILLQALIWQRNKKRLLKKEEIYENVYHLVNMIEKGDIISSTFCTGLAGTGWILQYLKDKKIINTPTSFLTELDSFLETEMNKMIKAKNYDIMHGYLGLGVYFLKRKKYKEIEKIIYSLNQSYDAIGSEIAWSRLDSKTNREEIYDFGLAHGNASILYFLGRCYQEKINREMCLKLIEGSINFFLANLQNPKTAVSFFPNTKKKKNYKIKPQIESSRLAWCYGDLSILYTLLKISIAIGNPILKENIIVMLEKLTARQNKKTTEVIDPFFCHGSSGVSYIFFSLYKLTLKKIFLQAAEFWLQKTIQFQNGENHFKENSLNKKTYDTKTNLLDGLAGISLLLQIFRNKKIGKELNEIYFL